MFSATAAVAAAANRTLATVVAVAAAVDPVAAGHQAVLVVAISDTVRVAGTAVVA